VNRAGDVVARLLAWADTVQRRHGLLGFPYAVVKKYGDDAAGRQAALITYYGFLSMFPLLLLAVSVLSTVLVGNAALREELIQAVVPRRLQNTVDDAVAAMPSSGWPFVIGLVGLLFAASGVVFSVYETLNHLAGVPMQSRFGFIPRYVRVMLMVVVVLAGGLGTATLTVVSGALPDVNWLQQVSAAVGTALVVFLVLIAAAKVLIARPVSVRAAWPAAALGAVTVAVVLTAGTRLLAALVTRAGPVYGSFATVAGIFALLYLVSQALLYAAEIAVVHHRGLWPRALDTARPTPADVRALGGLATEQKRLAAERIDVEFGTDSSTGNGDIGSAARVTTDGEQP
jgi:membrane protein